MNREPQRVPVAENEGETVPRRPSSIVRRPSSGAQRPSSFARCKVRGQTTVIIGLSMLALLAIVGLAVDGGSVYAQRRAAQNAADGAAMAGVRTMLDAYEHDNSGSGGEVDGSQTQERSVRLAITQYAALNGVLTNTLEAYFVDDNKQLVTVSEGTGGCGDADNPCPVGKNGSIPWTLGATGIIVTDLAQTGSFFFKIFGWNKIGSTASATAFMGVAADSSPETAILPIGFLIPNGIYDLSPGETFVLMDGDSRYDTGEWASVNYNNYSDTDVDSAWLDCGYKPSLDSQSNWNQWCGNGGHRNTHSYGPTQYWTGDTGPDEGPVFAPRLQWGAGVWGWWLAGSTMNASDNCDALHDIVRDLNDTDVLVPLFDMSTDMGADSKFHMREAAWFHIENSSVDCHVTNDPDPGEHTEWHVEGLFLQKVSPGSSGTHGDMRHNSLHVVFLEH